MKLREANEPTKTAGENLNVHNARATPQVDTLIRNSMAQYSFQEDMDVMPLRKSSSQARKELKSDLDKIQAMSDKFGTNMLTTSNTISNLKDHEKLQPIFMQQNPSQQALTAYNDAINDQRFSVLRQRTINFFEGDKANKKQMNRAKSQHQLNAANHKQFLKSQKLPIAAKGNLVGSGHSYQILPKNALASTVESLQPTVPARTWQQTRANYSTQQTKNIFHDRQLLEVNEILWAQQMCEDEKVQHLQNVHGLLYRQKKSRDLNAQVQSSLMQQSKRMKQEIRNEDKISKVSRKTAYDAMQRTFEEQFERKSRMRHEQNAGGKQTAATSTFVLNQGTKDKATQGTREEQEAKFLEVKQVVESDKYSANVVSGQITPRIRGLNKGKLSNKESSMIESVLRTKRQIDEEKGMLPGESVITKPWINMNLRKGRQAVRSRNRDPTKSPSQSQTKEFWSRNPLLMGNRQLNLTRVKSRQDLVSRSRKTANSFENTSKSTNWRQSQSNQFGVNLHIENQKQNIFNGSEIDQSHHDLHPSSNQIGQRNRQKPLTSQGPRVSGMVHHQIPLSAYGTNKVEQTQIEVDSMDQFIKVHPIPLKKPSIPMKQELKPLYDEKEQRPVVTVEEQKRIQEELDDLVEKLRKTEYEEIGPEKQLDDVEVAEKHAPVLQKQARVAQTVSSFPLKQDFVVFEPKLSLVSAEESQKFHARINQITGVAPEAENESKPRIAQYSHEQSLLYIDKSSIKETGRRVQQYRIEHFDKVCQADAELDALINEIKTEYLDKNLASKSLEQMNHQIVNKYKQITKQENQKYNTYLRLMNKLAVKKASDAEKEFIRKKLQHLGHFLKRTTSETGRVPSDYKIKMRRLGENAHFYDHKGNYITCTGHLVDDYAAQPNETVDPSKLKDRSDSVSFKKDTGRRAFITRDQIFEQVKNQGKIKVDLKRMAAQTKNELYTDLYKTNANNVRAASLARRQRELAMNQIRRGSPTLSSSEEFNEEGERSDAGSSKPMDTAQLMRTGKGWNLENTQRDEGMSAQSSSFEESDYESEDESAEDFTGQVHKLQRQCTLKEHKYFTKKVKSFNLDSEKIEVADALQVLGGEWEGLAQNINQQDHNSLNASERAQQLLKTYSLIINENVEFRLMFQRLDAFCTGKRNVSIHVKLKDADLAIIISKLHQLSPSLHELSMRSCEIGKASTEALIRLLLLHQGKSVQSLRILQINECKIQSTQLSEILKSLYKFREAAMLEEQSLQLSPLVLDKKQSTQISNPTKEVKKQSFELPDQAEQKKPVTFLALEKLDLEAVRLSSEHLMLLVPLLENSHSLKSLNLSYNHIGLAALEAFLLCVLEKDSLKYLNLSHLNLSNMSCQRVLEAIVKHSWSLKGLNLSYTQLSEPLRFLHEVKRHSQGLQCLHFDGLLKDEQEVAQATRIMESSSPWRIGLEEAQQKDESQTEKIGSLSLHPQLITSIKHVEMPDKRRIEIVDQRVHSPSRRKFPKSSQLQNDYASSCVFYRMLGHSHLFNPNGWRASIVDQSCQHCDNHRLCLILHFTSGSNAQNEKEAPILIANSERATKMVGIGEFCNSLGNIDSDNKNWLFWIKEKLKKHRPKILVSQRLNGLGFNRDCWIAVDYFKPNKAHSVEIIHSDDANPGEKQSLKMQFTVRDTGVVKAAQNVGCLDISNVNNYAEDLNPDLAESGSPSKKKEPALAIPQTLPKIKHFATIQQALKNPSTYQFSFLTPPKKTKFMTSCIECIESDYISSKITAVVDKVQQMQSIKNTLLMNKVQLIDMYYYLQTKSQAIEMIYPKVSELVVVDFLRDFGITDDPRIREVLDDILFKSMQSRMQMKIDNEEEDSNVGGGVNSTMRLQEQSSTFKQSPYRRTSLLTDALSHSAVRSKFGASRTLGFFSGQSRPQNESRGPGFKRHQFVEIICRIALLHGNINAEDESEARQDASKSTTRDEGQLILDFVEQKLLPKWSQMSQFDQRHKLIFTPQNDMVMAQHKNTLQALVEVILKDVGKTYVAGKLEVPLLALLKYFMNMTCERKDWAKLPVENAKPGALPVIGEVKEDQESLLASSPSNSSAAEHRPRVGKHSDLGLLLRCQLQPFTIVSAQDIFQCFTQSKGPMVDDNNDDAQVNFIEKQLTLLKQSSTLESQDQPIISNRSPEQPAPVQSGPKLIASYLHNYPLNSDHHTLRDHEFYEFIIRFAPKVVHGEQCHNHAADHYDWAHFCALDQFLQLVELKLQYEKM